MSASDPFGFSTANRVAAKIAQIAPELRKLPRPLSPRLIAWRNSMAFRAGNPGKRRSFAAVATWDQARSST